MPAAGATEPDLFCGCVLTTWNDLAPSSITREPDTWVIMTVYDEYPYSEQHSLSNIQIRAQLLPIFTYSQRVLST